MEFEFAVPPQKDIYAFLVYQTRRTYNKELDVANKLYEHC